MFLDLNWPLMENNITKDDLEVLIEFLKGMPILTQSGNVQAYEEEWSSWLGVRYSVFVNSGSSANFITMAVLKELYGSGEVIVPPLAWVSDIASVLHAGFTPVFVDINPRTLSMDNDQVISRITSRTKAVFLTHVQGFNGLTRQLLKVLKEKNIPLIEDVCEAHGATFQGAKLGTFGLVSNFSYYFAHHMSTIEGGMICTDDEKIYQICRMWRSHGMVREMTNNGMKQKIIEENPDLNPYFIFSFPGYNMRNTEIGAVIGRNQLKRLNENNEKRKKNFDLFLRSIDPQKYRTDFKLEGSCNYAFNLILKKADPEFRDRIMEALRESRVEFRRGSAGGGNQLRQPYLKRIVPEGEYKKYPEVEHIHFYGFYIGNYPDLPEEKTLALCDLLNHL
jgi:CDP-6-deoxy-D-xylo-4-hexulose-3-dehydrase